MIGKHLLYTNSYLPTVNLNDAKFSRHVGVFT